MFKESTSLFSPMSRKRFASSPSASHHLSPRFGRKGTVSGPKPSLRLPLSGGRKKTADPQAKALLSDLTSPQELIEEQCSLSMKDKVNSSMLPTLTLPSSLFNHTLLSSYLTSFIHSCFYHPHLVSHLHLFPLPHLPSPSLTFLLPPSPSFSLFLNLFPLPHLHLSPSLPP